MSCKSRLVDYTYYMQQKSTTSRSTQSSCLYGLAKLLVGCLICSPLLFTPFEVAADEYYRVSKLGELEVTEEEYQPSFRSLSTLQALYVNAGPLRGHFSKLKSKRTSVLLKEMQQRVESAGLRWLDKKAIAEVPGQPTLNFYPSFKAGCCTMGLWTGFSQGAKVLAAPEENFRLSSWGEGANHYGGEAGATCPDPVDWVYDNALEKLDAFLADHLKAKKLVPEKVPDPAGSRQNCSTRPILFVEMFDTNSSALGKEQRDILRELANTIRQCGDFDYRIEAHADHRGADEYNLALSRSRANAVRTYLIASGLKGARFQSKALGESRLVSEGQSTADLAANRRIVVTPLLRSALERDQRPPPSIYRLMPQEKDDNSKPPTKIQTDS